MFILLSCYPLKCLVVRNFKIYGTSFYSQLDLSWLYICEKSKVDTLKSSVCILAVNKLTLIHLGRIAGLKALVLFESISFRKLPSPLYSSHTLSCRMLVSHTKLWGYVILVYMCIKQRRGEKVKGLYFFR